MLALVRRLDAEGRKEMARVVASLVNAASQSPSARRQK
jgi:hypothetical protein